MDKKDIDWMVNIFPQYMTQVLRATNIEEYKRAETLIIGRHSLPSCGCQYHSYQNKINQLYDEWVKKINT